MWRCVVLLLVGCNELYGLEQTKPRDPTPPADADGDGVPDLTDNCADRANPAQHDSDADLRGDVCDECPLVFGPAGADADADGVGDACDPNPVTAGECLAILDTFADPTAFASHWDVVTSDASKIVPEAGAIVFQPVASSSTLEIGERSIAGLRGSVMVAGRAQNPSPAVVALSGMQAANPYSCGLVSNAVAAGGPGIGTDVIAPLVPDPSVGDAFLIRLDTTLEDSGLTTVLCRIDFGVSSGTQARIGQPTAAGLAGVRMIKFPVRIDAVAFVTTGAGTCATEYR